MEILIQMATKIFKHATNQRLVPLPIQGISIPDQYTCKGFKTTTHGAFGNKHFATGVLMATTTLNRISLATASYSGKILVAGKTLVEAVAVSMLPVGPLPIMALNAVVKQLYDI